MANIILSAKSWSDWTNNELEGFNIRVDSLNWTAFFNTQQLPAPNISEVILNNERPPEAVLTKADRLFFQYMRQAETGEESAVGDFAAHLLGMFDYDEPDRVIHQRKEVSFIMCGKTVSAKPDVVVMTQGTEYLLLVQEDKASLRCTSHPSGSDHTNAEARLIAEAIAAFSQNNLNRSLSNLPALPYQVIPGILMMGPIPIFYRIPVTRDLLRCVEGGKYPDSTTVVHRCIPPVPNQATYAQVGMVPVANRVVVLQCFEAFKSLVGVGM